MNSRTTTVSSNKTRQDDVDKHKSSEKFEKKCGCRFHMYIIVIKVALNKEPENILVLMQIHWSDENQWTNSYRFQTTMKDKGFRGLYKPCLSQEMNTMDYRTENEIVPLKNSHLGIFRT